MKSRTTTARQLVRKEKLDLDEVYKIVNSKGMEPQRLHPRDVEEIIKQLSPKKIEQRAKAGKTLDDSVINLPAPAENLIVCLTTRDSDGTYVKRYMYAKDLNELRPDIFQQEISYEDFVRHIDASLSEVDPQRIRETSGELIKKEKPTKGKRTTTKANTQKQNKKIRASINKNVAEDMIRRSEEIGLRRILYGDLKEAPINVTHSAALLSTVVRREVQDNLKSSGYTIEALTPTVLMELAIKNRNARLRKEVRNYFGEGKGSFLTTQGEKGFDTAWNTDDDVRQVISWLEENIDDSTKSMPFYINCIKQKFAGKFASDLGESRKNTLFQAWGMGASHYEFVRSHPAVKNLLKGKKAKSDDLAERMIKRFVGDENYQQRDAVRIMGGLFVAGKLEVSSKQRTSDFQNVERLGNDVDYVITSYENIGNVVHSIIGRIRSGNIKRDSVKANQELYKSIREGNYSIENTGDIKHLKRAIKTQMTQDEKAQFRSRLVEGRTRSEGSIDKMIEWYVINEGNKVLN